MYNAALEWNLSTSALVLRGNKLCEINITDMVPGNVVYLSKVRRRSHSQILIVCTYPKPVKL